jgi:gliding motility-associated-like protein
MRAPLKILVILCLFVSLTRSVSAACPGAPTVSGFTSGTNRAPIWTSCRTAISLPSTPKSYGLSFSANATLTDYKIIWGDGKADSTGASLPIGSPLNHTYDSLGEYGIKIISLVGGTCWDTIYGTVRNLRPVSSSIKPLPSGQNAGCAPHSIVFEDQTDNALPGTILTWNFGDGTTVIRSYDSANQSISHTYVSGSVPACTTQVSLTANNANCTIGPSTYTVSPILILDKDQAVIGPPSPGTCSPSRTYTFPNNTVVNCPTLHAFRVVYWDFGDGTHDATWNTNYGSRLHTFPDSGSYTITLMDSNDCGLSVTTTTININFPPVVGFTATPKVGCMPLTVNFNDTSLGIGNTSAWLFNDPYSSVGNLNTSTLKAPVHRFDSAGTYTVRLRVSNPCTASSSPNYIQVTQNITVYGKPRVLIGSLKNGCAPLTVSLKDSTKNIRTSGVIYAWDFGNGQTSTAKNPTAVTYTVAGTYQVKLIVTDTCGIDSVIRLIRVDSVPTALFVTDTVCKFDTTHFNATSSIKGAGDVLSYKWYIGTTPIDSSKTIIAPTFVYNGAGFNYQAVLKVTTDKGCIDYDTNTVRVNVSPTLAILTSPAKLCDTGTVIFIGDTTGSSTPLTSYRWTFGTGTDTAFGKDTAYRFPTPGTYTIRYVVGNSINCSSTVTKNITIHPLPDARPTVSTFCFQQFTQFRDSSTVGFGNTIDSTQWDFTNDGIVDSLTKNPSFKFGAANTFMVKLRVVTNNGCANTDSMPVTIYPLPNPSITDNGTSKCKQDTFVFGNTTTGAVSYQWRFGDATPDSITTNLVDLKKVYADTGAFLVKMIATSVNGCIDSSVRTIQSRPFPVAHFTMNDTLSCAPKTFVFTNTSTLADGYVWRVNGMQTSTAFNRPDTAVNVSGQLLTISLIATNSYGCRPDTTSQIIQTISNPTPNFTISADSGCGPHGVNFTNTSVGATSYQWQLGNGTFSNATDTAATYQASLLNDSIYSVKLIAFNGPGCKDSISKTVTVFPKPTSSFTQNETANCGPLPVLFTNTSNHKYGGTIDDLAFNWRFDNNDSSTVKDPASLFDASAIQDTVYHIRLIATTVFGCSDTALSDVRVYPNPRASYSVSATQGCGPLAIHFNNTSVPNDTGNISIMTFEWDFKNGSTSTAVHADETFFANLTKDTVYQTQLIATSEHGCRDTLQRSIRVFPKPHADFTMPNDSGCSPFNALFTNTSIPHDTGDISIMSFVWDLGNGFSNITQDAFGQYLSKQVLDSSYTVKLFATSEHGCKDTARHTVVSHPIPVASFTNNISQGCGPLGVQFTSNSTLANSYKWNFGDGGTSMLSGPLHSFQSYPLVDSVFSVSFSVLSVFGCESDTVRGNIITRYKPIADFITGADSICSSGPISFTNQSIGAITNSWNFGTGNTSSAINPVAQFAGLPDRDTAYSVRLIVTSPYSCKDTAIKQITVNPLPDAQFDMVVPGCTPLPVTFNNTSLRGVRHEWDFGDGGEDSVMNPSKVFVNGLQLTTQQFLVTLKTVSQSGCIDTAKQVVTIYPKPIAAFSSPIYQGCGPLSVSFNNQSVSNHSGSLGMTFEWDFGTGDTSTQATPTAVFPPNATKDTIYFIKLKASSEFGCLDTAYNAVRVYPKPSALFTVSDSVNCGPMNVQFTNQSVPNDTGSINVMSFVWDLGNGFSSIQRNPSSQFINLGLTDSVYAVRLVGSSEHGCKDTTVHSIVVKPKPIASFTQDKTTGCGPFDVSFTNTSLVGVQYKWTLGKGDTSTQQHPIQTYLSYPLVDSTYVVSLVALSDVGCVSDTARKTIVAKALPIAGFTISADTICDPESVSFLNNSLGWASLKWNFGNGDTTISVNPVHAFSGSITHDTSYLQRLVVTTLGGCKDTAYKTITVKPKPDASFAAITPGCTPLATSLNNTSTGAVRYEWSFGDGSSDTLFAPNKVFTGNVPLSNTSYVVTLKAYSTFGCLDTAKQLATVYPKPIAAYIANATEGCGPLPILFTNQSASNLSGSVGMTYNWNFRNGDSSSLKSPQSIFASNLIKDTIYNVQLIGISEYGCSDTVSKPIRVFPKPKALFSPDKLSGCTPLTVNFTNQSYPNDTGSIAIMNFVWNYGNGITSIGQDASSELLNSRLTDTTFAVKLIASSEHGCRDTVSQNIVVNPKPLAAFTQDKILGCGPFTVNFSNTSSNSTIYNWHFGDGDSSNLVSPTHVFQSYPLVDTFYTVSLVTESAMGCISDTVRKTIIGKYIPDAAFVTSSDSTCNPGSISFYNASVGGSTNNWNFGNGATSSAINPVATFSGPLAIDTNYQVRLVIASPAGCKDTSYKTIKVNPLPVASFASVAPGCTPLSVNFNNTSQRAVSYEWEFGDGATAVGPIASKVFTNSIALADRNYTVTLKAFTASGCMDTARHNITVFPLPLVNYTANKTLKCDTAEYVVINSSQGAANYVWKQQNQVVSSLMSPMVYFPTAINVDSTHQLKLVAISNKGCSDSIEKPVTIKPLVKADFTSTGTSSCSNLNVLFANKSRNGFSYFWLFGDGTGSPLSSPQHKYTNTGSYDVKLIAYDAFGCSDTAVRANSVTIYEVPTANFLYSPPTAALPNSTIEFTNLSFVSSGNLSHQWIFGDAASTQNSSSEANPTHSFTDSGNYAVQLVVNTIHNCFDTMTQTLRIRPHPPVPAFTYNPSEGCSPLTVQFTNQSEYADAFEWTFDDGQTSTDKDPVVTFKFPGKYGAFLRAKGPGGEQQVRKDEIIEVFSLPRANFFATPIRLVLPNATVTLTDISSDAVAWKWRISKEAQTYFKDTKKNTAYTFEQEGKYDVQLTAITDKGCLDSMIRPDFIDVIRGGYQFIGNAFTPDGDGINDVFKPVLQGVLSEGYLFEIFNRWGEVVFRTNDVNAGWDGGFSGKPANIDTYVWIVRGYYTGNIGFSEEGNVTLIR